MRLPHRLLAMCVPAVLVISTGQPAFAAAVPRPSKPRPPVAAAASPSDPIAPGAERLAATADGDGYHLFAASAGDAGRWRALATVRPMASPQPWIGEHCLTGDGRYAVVVVAPWSAQNSPAGFATGGLAYAVDAHTGAVRPLVSGVSLAYFNPGCGSGSRVALVRYTQPDEAATSVVLADAATGTARVAAEVDTEITSAVPAGGAVLAAHGHDLVRVDRDRMLTLATLPGQVHHLAVRPDGRVDFRTTGSGGTTRTWQLTGRAARASSAVTPATAPAAAALPRPAPAARSATPAAWPASPNITSATCSVPRDDPAYQVRQPSSPMIEWASNHAGRSAGSVTTQFPLPAPFGPGGAHIPREVLDGIMAQESNWHQASPHAPPGIPGNPYVADYYGSYASGTIDYNIADCGYGLGQVTDGMRLANPGDAPTGAQAAIATDYRANVAATAQILAGKWNELISAGIRFGINDPDSIEDWYLALWDYNSGLHPDDGAGNHGLGWANNPANPVYDPVREPFLRTFDPLFGWIESYDDAAHPAGWPYQEKVFGWMETAQYEPDGVTKKFAGTADYTLQTGLLYQPDHTAFCTASSDCVVGPDGSGQCQRGDFHCWWHDPSTGCGILCTYTHQTVSDSAAEPAVADPHPPLCSSSGLPAGTVIVDDEPTDANLVGCPNPPSGWSSTGSFTVAYDTDPNDGGAETGRIDWHQLGAGFGGHFWFTHTESPGSIYGATAYWRPNRPLANYRVSVFVPDLGAVAVGHYEVFPGGGAPARYVDVDQSAYSNQWVTLGTYPLAPDAFVALSSDGGGNGSVDLAFDAVAFTPLGPTAVSYAALGDSYSSGVGGGSYDAGTDTSSDKCRRSPDAFPRQYAAIAGTGVNHLACSGAVTNNITTTGQYGEPAQLSALPATSGLVTVTIGGNNVGFAGVLTKCVTASTSLCEDFYSQADGNNLDNKIDNLEPVLVATYRAVRQKAGNARVIAVTYPNIFAPGTEGKTQTTCLSIGAIADSDVEWLIDELFHLDDVIVAAAREAGVQVLDERYAFHGHELCTANPWVNSLTSPPITDLAKAFHPNTSGYAQLAADLNTELTNPATITPVVWAGWVRPLPGMPTTADAVTWFNALTIRLPSTATYPGGDRFATWIRQPDNCNRRTGVLTRDADPATIRFVQPPDTRPACTIAYGDWQSPYDDPAGARAFVHGNPSPVGGGDSPVDVDHVVSKKDAWLMGADTWTPAKRTAFANLMGGLELLSVAGTTNSAKGERGPESWTPDVSGNPAFTCDYLKMYIAVKWQWDLGITQAQHDAINARIHGCP